MCGIVGCLGEDNIANILIDGLERLEYRGYDSSGIALVNKNKIELLKRKGKVAELSKAIAKNKPTGSVGIGHTRWATHGEPSDANAHPHLSPSGRFAIVHNGIIENYLSIKQKLISQGVKFKSETDTEVLVCLIESVAKTQKKSGVEAVRLALKQVVGAYAIAVIDNQAPDQLIVARKSSPLVVGINKKSFYVASDVTPIAQYTQEVIYLNDNDLAILETGKKPKIIKINDASTQKSEVEHIEFDVQKVGKDGFDHFMKKEIFEQPQTIIDSLRGRILPKEGIVKFGGIEEYEEHIAGANRIIIIACGTSWHAGLVAEYAFEKFAEIPVEVEYASEFRYRDPIIKSGEVVIAISQSGETADTLAALELAKNKGALILGICNVVGSSIARFTDGGIYTHAGPEISVASTKAFTAQVSVLLAMAIRIGQLKRSIGPSQVRELITELSVISSKVEQILKQDSAIKRIALDLANSSTILFLGRGLSFPVALEGALKLKEISYIHAEGYPAGEMKHGPIALVDEKTPVVVVAPKDSHFEKSMSNLQEIKARGGRVLLVTSQTTDKALTSQAEWCIEVPHTNELLTPLLTNIPLQLLSYHTAVAKGCEVDKPRNLAKSVTVE